MKIGLIGKNGAGKSSVCAYLRNQGYDVISLSDFVREAAKKKKLDLNRQNLIQTANELKAELGNNILAKKALHLANEKEKVVFDSIRHPDEVLTLKKAGVKFIGIDADIKRRFERIRERGGGTDHITFDEFKDHDETESNGKSTGQNLTESMKQTDATIMNDNDLNTLYQRIDQVLNELTHEQR